MDVKLMMMMMMMHYTVRLKEIHVNEGLCYNEVEVYLIRVFIFVF